MLDTPTLEPRGVLDCPEVLRKNTRLLPRDLSMPGGSACWVNTSLLFPLRRVLVVRQTSDAYPTLGSPQPSKHSEKKGEMAAVSPQRFQILIHSPRVLRVAQQLLHLVRRVCLSLSPVDCQCCWLGELLGHSRGLEGWLSSKAAVSGPLGTGFWEALHKEEKALRLLLPGHLAGLGCRSSFPNQEHCPWQHCTELALFP